MAQVRCVLEVPLSKVKALTVSLRGRCSGLIATRPVQVGGQRGLLAAGGGRLVQGRAAGTGGGEGQDREVQVGDRLVTDVGQGEIYLVRSPILLFIKNGFSNWYPSKCQPINYGCF